MDDNGLQQVFALLQLVLVVGLFNLDILLFELGVQQAQLLVGLALDLDKRFIKWLAGPAKLDPLLDVLLEFGDYLLDRFLGVREVTDSTDFVFDLGDLVSEMLDL